MQDLDMNDEANIIDPTTMRRVKEKVAATATVAHLKQITSLIESELAIGVYFDARNDNTFTVISNPNTNRNHPRIEKQSHYAVVIQPEDKYYTHRSEWFTRYKCSRMYIQQINRRHRLQQIEFHWM